MMIMIGWNSGICIGPPLFWFICSFENTIVVVLHAWTIYLLILCTSLNLDKVLFFETADKTVNGGKCLSTMYLSSTYGVCGN